MYLILLGLLQLCCTKDASRYHNYLAETSDAGKLRQEGKEHIVQDGDVMHFKFNV